VISREETKPSATWLDHHNKIAEAAEFHTLRRMEALPNLGFSPSARSQDLFYSAHLEIYQTDVEEKTHHSAAKQRPGEGKNNLNQTAAFLPRGTLA
jgi:hypothetical protein